MPRISDTPVSSIIPATLSVASLPRVPMLTDKDGMTDTANALRLVQSCGSEIRYVLEWKEWLVWDGRCWAHEGFEAIRLKAKEQAAKLWTCLADTKLDESQRRQIFSFATHSNSLRGLNAAVNLAQDHVSIHVSCLDAHPMLLNTLSGTVDLKTGKLYTPRPDDYLTHLCPTEYSEESTCPLWERTVLECMGGNVELVQYLQRLFGYGLTGRVGEQILPIFWGEGRNGKSTLLDVVSKVLGRGYTGTAPRELFMSDKYSGSRHPTQIMTLQGKRLVVVQETDQECRINEAMVKHMTGGDMISGRGMYENFSSFPPSHKLILCTNYQPQIRGTNEAIWGRVKLVPFTQRFCKAPDVKRGERQAILDLDTRLLREAPGILRWMVKGCIDWQNKGLRDPECVKIATQQYRTEQDVIGAFIKERCLEIKEGSVMSSDLYQAYKEWATEGVLSPQGFGRELTRRGYEKFHKSTGPGRSQRAWKGLKLRY